MTDILAVWGAWRAYHPSARGTPSAGATAVVKAALREWAAHDLALVVAWAHDAPHDRASYLRGAEYERHRRGEDAGASSVGAYLALPNLLTARTLDQRAAWATEWDRAGRPVFTDAGPAKASEPDRVAALVSMLEELVEHGGDPDQCANPGRARKVLGVWYGHGGGPASVASLAMRDRTFALRDIATAMVRARMAQQNAPRAEVPRG